MTQTAQHFRPDIPRHPRWGGPLILPPGVKHEPGPNICPTCKRANKTKKCPHVYYRRTTTFIDVLQSEFALKMWDRRQVAYGMGQRPDLVLAAAACRNNPADQADKDKLQQIADSAKEHAQASAGANIGTALHTMTEWMDTGQPLGHVPEPYPADLKAYEEATKGIEWVAVESFRVNDEHQVAGTADRVGYYRGRLAIFDLKTSPNDNAVSYPHGPAMQLAMYAHSIPYDIATDARVFNHADIDLNRAYIISLPAGKGRCEIRPVNIAKGWGACQLAVKVWHWRGVKDLISEDVDPPLPPTWESLIADARDLDDLRLIWKRMQECGRFTPELGARCTERSRELAATTE